MNASSVLISESASFAPSVLMHAAKGIVSDGSLSSLGDVVLEGGSLSNGTFSDYSVDLRRPTSAGGSLSLESSGHGRVRLVSPGSLIAGAGIVVGGPVELFGSGVYTFDSDSDLDGDGKLVLAGTSNLTVASPSVSGVSVVAADVDVLCSVLAGSASVSVQP